MRVSSALRLAHRLVDGTAWLAMWLALPLAVLLFAQWPLRDLVHAGSLQANDAAQCLFALYVSVALTAATRQRTHLAAHVPPRLGEHGRRLLLLALPGGITLLWGLYVLWSSAATVWQSLRGAERFAETLDPGYFLIRLGVWVMAALVVVQGVVMIAEALRPTREVPHS